MAKERDFDAEIAKYEAEAAKHKGAAEKAEELRYQKFKARYSALDEQSDLITQLELEASKVSNIGVYKVNLYVQAPDSEEAMNFELDATGAHNEIANLRNMLSNAYFTLARNHVHAKRLEMQAENRPYYERYISGK